MKYKSILWALGSMLFSACAVEDVANPSTVDENGMQTITVESASFDEPATRVNAVVKPTGGYTFPWQNGDQIAVYGSSDEAKGWGFFTLAGGVGDSSGNFKGIFKLQPTVDYFSFYPALEFTSRTNANAIPVDYTGQVQTKDADLSHLSNYIYMAAKGDESYNFKSKHVGSLVKIQLQDPNYEAAYKIVLSTDENDFVLKGTVDLTTTTASAAPDITPTQKSSTFEIGYKVGSATIVDNTITAYAMIAPTDLSGKELKATVKHTSGDDAVYALESDPVNPFVKGKAYTLTGTIDEIDQTKEYLTFTAQEDNSIIGLVNNGGNAPNIEYSFDKVNWTPWDYSAIALEKDQKVFMRGNNDRFSSNGSKYSNFAMTGKIAANGNVMSLLYAEDFENKISLSSKNSCFLSLFVGCTSLTTAPEFPATVLAQYCYESMFSGCTSLTTSPRLPATSLAIACYYEMFSGCTSLTIAPELPATTLLSECYIRMFKNCTNLTTTPELPATALVSSCYYEMFSGCTSLTKVPSTLPATNLTSNCYSRMFSGCTSLTKVPSILLPATILASGCYNEMFSGCTSLTEAPELPARTSASSCYRSMFSGCTSLTTAPDLPATSLAEMCYTNMFGYCTSLTKAPELPAKILGKKCYEQMFLGCTGLTIAPELPATSLSEGCYNSMFYHCTSLAKAPELPATVLNSYCYEGMFAGCASLTTAPELPATTLVDGCYCSMFSGCTSLTKVPSTLPATNLTSSCYSRMFSGCTSLTTAPELPATTLVSGCYESMFDGCTKLKYVKVAFTTVPSSSYTKYWLRGVSSAGTFYKNKNATWNVTGYHGIPSSWTVIEYEP